MGATVAAEPPSEPQIVHATTVALGSRALLITGPSGAGKSELALMLMGLGAALVADDRTELTPQASGPPIAQAPEAIRGIIEARGVGLLLADAAPPTPLAAVLDLSETETQRLPQDRSTKLLGTELPLLHKVETAYFPAVLIQYLKFGKVVR